MTMYKLWMFIYVSTHVDGMDRIRRAPAQTSAQEYQERYVTYGTLPVQEQAKKGPRNMQR